MKRLFVVAGLLVLMLGLRALGTGDDSGAGALTLAAIGFVILAAFAIAELLARSGLPKVTGYILSGVVLGPHVADVLSLEVVDEMRMFNTLAVGLIALMAGLELEVHTLRKLGRTLGATTLAKLVITVPLVAATLIGTELVFHLLDSPDFTTTVALGLVFGALAVGTSPSISLAIISETGARGRLAELVLGAAVLKDLVVVVFLALAIAAAHSLVGVGTFRTDVLMHIGEVLGLSILVGIAIGGLLIAYLRFIKAEMLLFVAGLVLVVAELAEPLPLDLLLVFIVAGFVVRNLSEYEHDLLPPLRLVSLPVFVVFFTIAGASVDLGTTITLLPLALALCLVRAGSYWLSARLGNQFGNESQAVSANAWLGYLPQAGVTLGLVGLAIDRLPELSSWIGSLGLLVVSINLFIGPLTLRKALERAGEIPNEAPETAEAERPVAEGETPSVPAEIGLEDARLEANVRQLHARLEEQVERTIAGFVEPWLTVRRQRFAALPDDAGPDTIALADAHPASDARGFSRVLAKSFERSAAELEALDYVAEVAMESKWWKPSTDEAPLQALRRVLRRSTRRVGHRRSARRRIPLQLAARTAYEPNLATAMLELLRASCRCDARLAELMHRRLDDKLAAGELAPAVAAILDDFATVAREIPRAALAKGDRALRQVAECIDSPVMSIRSLEFSEVASAIERDLVALQDEAEAWPTVINACWQSVAVAARVHILHEQLAGGRATIGELERAGEAIDEGLGAFERRLGELRAIFERSVSEAERVELLADAVMRCRALLPKPTLKRLRQLEPRLRRLAELRAVRQGVRELFARETGSRSLASAELALSVTVPAQLRVREIDVSELIDGEISGRLLPRTQQQIEVAALQVDESVQAATAIVDDIELLLEIYRTQESDETELDTLRTSLDRILVRASELHVRAITELQTIGAAIAEDFDGLAPRLTRALDEAVAASDANWVSRRADLARLDFGPSLTDLRARATRASAELVRRISAAAESLNEDYRLRSGQSLLSANEIAAMLPSPPSRLPRDYLALFTEQPIRDPRFFVANREALRSASKAEREWNEGSSGNGLLVIGGPGTGKTSLLAVAQLKLSTREILWLPVHERGLINALAGELHCPAHEQRVLHGLRDRKRVVIIDDLQRLLTPGPDAGNELQCLIRLIAATSATCFWLVSVERELQRLVEPLIGLRVAFAAVVEIDDGRDIDELETTVIARHRISGKPLTYPPAPRLRGLLTRIPGVRMRSQEREFFTRLAEVSKGNLRAALAEWCRRAEVEGKGLVLAPAGRSRGLPFVRQLPPTALSVLATLLRFGPCRSSELAKALTSPPDELARWLHFLSMAGLIAGDEHDGYHCPARVRDGLAPELAELQVFHGGVG